MKRKISTLLLALVMMLSCIQLPAAATTSMPTDSEPIEAAFTDAAFLTAVRETIGKTNGEHIYAQDVEGITKLEIVSLSIANLDGIEYFTALKELYCYDNDILMLDLSHNPNLEVLDCSYNTYLEFINLSSCPELRSLDCNYTALQRLDVRNNTKLTSLVCYSTLLRTLNVSNNTLLETLEAYDTRLVNLDVSNNSNLEYLDCSYNNMHSIESVKGLGNCTALLDDAFLFEPQNTDPVTESFTDEKFLSAVRGAIEKPNGDIYAEDLLAVTDLTVNNSGIKSLDGIEYMTSLENLDCTSNYLTELDLYSNDQLKTVLCADNDLTELDLSGNGKLMTLNASENALADLNVSKNPMLAEINVSNNELTALDLSANSMIMDLNCSENELGTIDGIKLPESVLAKLPSEVSTSFDPVTSAGLTMEFLPQYNGLFDVNISLSGQILSFSGRGAPKATVKLYDITGCDFTGIPEKYLQDKAQLYGNKADQKKIIYRLMDAGSFVGQATVAQDKSFGGELPLTIQSPNGYKFIAVLSNKKGPENARVIDVPFTSPYVKSLTFNNNYYNSAVVDVFGTTNPIIKTYGYFKRKSTFIVGIENAETIDRAYIRVSRQYQNRNDDRNKDIELKKTSDGTYQAMLNLTGSEGSLNANSSGKIEIKCIYKGESEMKLLYSKDVKIILDPSGYIYEGVPSNRLSGVSTTLYYKDRDGVPVKWDATEYNQINPILTEKDGRFEWFVPSGLWQVKAERDGYEPFYTDWMRVPPAQMDVNFGMISKEKPAIAQLCAYPDVIEINFNKYVYAEDITTGNVVIYADGQQVQGTVRLVNSEVDSWVGEFNQEASGGTGNRYVSQIRFFPSEELPLDTTVKISLNENIRSYAGVTVESGYSQESVVAARPTNMKVGSDSDVELAGGSYIVYYGETSTMKMSLLPLEASRGKKLVLINDNPGAISVPTEVIVDENGVAEIPMTGLALGEAQITMLLEGSNLSNTVDVEINLR